MKNGSPKGHYIMCRRKKRYTARRAFLVAERVSTNGSEPRVYHCPICGEFHIGRQKEKLKTNKIYKQS